MELPRRTRGDELLRPGAAVDIRRRLRRIATGHDLASVIVCAFDHRTRMLPFFFADLRMAPAGVRAIGSALVDSGFEKTRIVLQQWNHHFQPSRMRLDGRIPDLLLISSMGLHSEEAMRLVRDAWKIDPENRPLIILGGPHCVYQPWEVFSANPACPASADVAVTGEEYVLLSLLEVLLSLRGQGQSLRSAFYRARDSGALEGIPGLVYADGRPGAVAEELVDTGIQRLLGDLDELPHPVIGYGLLERPSDRPTLAERAMEPGEIARFSPLGSLVLTFGCKFACPYCPIPAYNQRQHRLKSGGRIADEMYRLNREYGLRYFFGADDNFFNNKTRTLDILETMLTTEFNGKPLRRDLRWGTEVTVHDTLLMKDHLRLVHRSGCRALWLGVEDMTATLVKKGQSVSKTIEAFSLLRDNGICPMPMMMHHDSQPFYSRGTNYGLINQVRLLRRAGAASLQVLMITPATGSKLYEETYNGGQVFDRVGGQRVTPHMLDGNYVVASRHRRPFLKQLNIMLIYVYFYNPIVLVGILLGKQTRISLKAAAIQVIGMAGVMQTIRRTFGWSMRLLLGKIQRRTTPPHSPIAMRSVDGGQAGHECASPSEKEPELVQMGVAAR